MRPSATLVFVALLALPAAGAQTTGSCAGGTDTDDLAVSDVFATLPNIGALFYVPLVGANLYLVPRDSATSPIYSAALWVGGTIGAELRTAASTYSDFEFWPGPLDPGAALPNPTDCTAYDRIWTVSTIDVASYEAGGVPTPDLAEWPIGLGAPAVDGSGSPIVTTDRMRVLDLAAGERPVIYGTQTAFWVMNDVGNQHTFSGSTPLGVEVQVAAFAIASSEPAFDQATFYRYRFVNRNSAPIGGLRAGLYVDPDLGDGSDDHLGSDSARGILFVHNVDNLDGPPGFPGTYGDKPPAVGFDVLSGTGAALWLGKSCPNPYCEPNRGMTTPVELYRLLQGVWRDGTPVTEGGVGYNGGGAVVTSSFPGAPESGAFWSMACPNSPSCGTPLQGLDQRGVVASSPVDLAPGALHDVTLAVLFARGDSHLNSVSQLRAASDLVQAAYDDGSLFDTVPVASAPGPTSRNGFVLRSPVPNPAGVATEVAYVVGAAGLVRVAVYDVLGREVVVLADGYHAIGSHRASLEALGLAPGVYVVGLRAQGVRLAQRLVIAR